MKICKICGSKIQDNQNICDNCDLSITMEINELKERINKNNLIVDILEK